MAQQAGTVVVLMGLRHLPTIAAALIGAGRPGTTPAAVIQEGTTAVRADGDRHAGHDRRRGGGGRSCAHPPITVIGDVVGVLS